MVEKAAIVLFRLKAIHPSILESQGSYNIIDQFSSKCVRHGGMVRSSTVGGGERRFVRLGGGIGAGGIFAGWVRVRVGGEMPCHRGCAQEIRDQGIKQRKGR